MARDRLAIIAPRLAVIAAHAGIQYSRAPMFDRKSSAILGRPVEPGDDGSIVQ
jgi:hypothetical protein